MSYKNSCGYLIRKDRTIRTGYKCIHPIYGEINTKLINEDKLGLRQCDNCKRKCKGIYPSQIPKCDISNFINILDKNN